jgi:hypothetical protein
MSSFRGGRSVCVSFFLIQVFPIVFLGALRAKSMAELRIGMIRDIAFDVDPGIVLFADALAEAADRKDPLQGLHFSGKLICLPFDLDGEKSDRRQNDNADHSIDNRMGCVPWDVPYGSQIREPDERQYDGEKVSQSGPAIPGSQYYRKKIQDGKLNKRPCQIINHQEDYRQPDHKPGFFTARAHDDQVL